MNWKIFSLALILSLTTVGIAKGQILISLLFGDKLNSGNIEFGLDGGLALSSISNLENTKMLRAFNLGFYFDIKMKENLFLHTGVIVKSPMGADKLEPYPLAIPNLDSLMRGGSVKRELGYFNVPVMVKYKFENQLFVEGGFQLGLLNKANDAFSASIVNDDDLEYDNDIKNEFKTFDYGVIGGLGYKLLDGKGMNLGVRYYYGLADILKDNPGDPHQNQVIYIYAGIPIGAKKAGGEGAK